MTMAALDTHPRQRLLFFLVQGRDASSRDTMVGLVSGLERSRDWLLGPPRTIDVFEMYHSREGDLRIDTLGGELEICSALGPVALPDDVDAVFLSEVRTVVEAVRRTSKDYGLCCGFELDDTYVGTIEDGDADATLQLGLLDSWHERLEKDFVDAFSGGA